MKICPRCSQTFSDDNLYCLSDGTLLAFSLETQEDATVIKPLGFVQPPPPVRQGINPIFIFLGVGLLAAVFVVGVAAVWVIANFYAAPIVANNRLTDISSNKDVGNTISNKNAANDSSDTDRDRLNEQKANLASEQAAIEKEKKRLADERRRLDAEKNKSANKTTSLAAQPTARISFDKGNSQQIVSGTVGSQRSFVLGAGSGQYLYASVSSANNCVAFSNGSNSIGGSTVRGDNRITIINNCSSAASFTLTVGIR